MNKLLTLLALPTLLILVSSLQAMAPATNQPTTATAATGAQAPQKPFKFHLRMPSLARKAAARTKPAAAEAGYQAQLALEAQIQKAKEIGDTKKVAELEKQRKVIPWSTLEEVHAMQQDAAGKIAYALKKDDPELLQMAMEKRKIDSTTKKPVIDLTTGTPVLEAITLDRFTDVAKKSINVDAKRSFEFLLSHAENIPLETLNELLNEAFTVDIVQPLIDRALKDTQYMPNKLQFFTHWNEFPLHKAVVEKRPHEVARLIDNKADVNFIAHSRTPLMLISQYGNDENSEAIAQNLIKHGAKVNLPNSNGSTALHRASSFNNVPMAQLLLNNKANINAPTVSKDTPLHIAAHENHPSMAAFLINNHANLNAQNRDEDTPLHVATITRNPALVKLLLDAGADTSLQNFKGKTALTLAVEHGYKEIVELLRPKYAASNEEETEPEDE